MTGQIIHTCASLTKQYNLVILIGDAMGLGR